MEKQNTFRIGISMAGAVSAGAYTAGAMDYLLEALENWQKAKELNLPGVPKHDIFIEVIGGASAGGMTAVITSAALQKEFPHINLQNYLTDANKENPLFDSWVNLTEEPANDMMTQMLNTDDILSSQVINPEKEVRSVFNSDFIGKIAERTLDAIIKAPNIKRPYIADDLELFTTITNLRGFNYEMQFITALGPRDDCMTMHKDIVHFQVNPTGSYKNDGKIPVHFTAPDGLNKKMLIDAAIATGAFPVGLSPREVVRSPKYINDNPLLQITHGKGNLLKQSDDYTALCVDGGVINNEPYDLTWKILLNRRLAEIEQENGKAAADNYQMAVTPSTFDTTILMIDPFPNYDDKPASDYVELLALKYTTPDLFGAMRKQLMFKTDVLMQAYDTNDYTRFMIAPIRTIEGVPQTYSIACGSLQGFGGFFSKQFRIHDYMLGRRNCQRFIQQYFCVPVLENNPIIQFGYGGLDQSYRQFFTRLNPTGLPIIPDIRISDDRTHIIQPSEEIKFPYPSISLKYLLDLEKKVQKRSEVLLDNILNSKKPGSRSSSENSVVQRIRKKGWFGENIIGPLGSFTAKKFISLGKSVVKNMAARKFIDIVITDVSTRGLLNEDC